VGGQSANGYAEVLANNVTLNAILIQMLKVSVTIRTEVRLLRKQSHGYELFVLQLQYKILWQGRKHGYF